MALAIISQVPASDPAQLVFRFDLGKNRYFQYLIGPPEVLRDQGFKRMDRPSHTSAIIGPLSSESLGRGKLEVPAHLFNRTNHSLQLISYRDEHKNGIALSPLIRVNGINSRAGSPAKAMTHAMSTEQDQTVEQVPFSYRETQLSSGMFLGALTTIIPKVLPVVGGLLGGGSQPGGGLMNTVQTLAPALAGTVGGGNPAAGAPAAGMGGIIGQIAQNPQLISMLTQMLAGGGQTATAQSVMQEVALAQSYSGEMGLFRKRKGNARRAPARKTPLLPARRAPVAAARSGMNGAAAPRGGLLQSVLGKVAASATNPNSMLGQGIQNMVGRATGMDPTTIAQLQQLLAQLAQNPQNLQVNPHPQPVANGTAQAMALPALAALGGMGGAGGGMAAMGGMGGAGGGMAAAGGGASQMIEQLMPLLQQIANPETINAIGDSGAKLLDSFGQNQTRLIDTVGNHVGKAAGAVGGFIKDFLGMKEMPILEAPSLDDPAMDRIMMQENMLEHQLEMAELMAQQKQGMSGAMSYRPSKLEFGIPSQYLDFRRLSNVVLEGSDLVPITLTGRPRVVFSQTQDMSIPLTLSIPKPINKAIIRVCLKDLETNRILLQKTLKLNQLSAGPIPEIPTFSAAELRHLTPSEDYLLSVRLIWKNRKGERIGTSFTQVITLAGPYLFDNKQGGGKKISLNHVQKYRKYWHKIWAEELTDEVDEYEIDCRYYYILESDRERMGQMESLIKYEEPHLGESKGKLKSGLIFSPFALNQLLSEISDHPSLTPDQLSAILSPDFVESFNQKAQFKAKMKGRTGQSLALWMFPEVELAPVRLQKAGEINENGRITQLAEEQVFFPVPVTAHYIGARN